MFFELKSSSEDHRHRSLTGSRSRSKSLTGRCCSSDLVRFDADEANQVESQPFGMSTNQRL